MMARCQPITLSGSYDAERPSVILPESTFRADYDASAGHIWTEPVPGVDPTIVSPVAMRSTSGHRSLRTNPAGEGLEGVERYSIRILATQPRMGLIRNAHLESIPTGLTTWRNVIQAG